MSFLKISREKLTSKYIFFTLVLESKGEIKFVIKVFCIQY